MKLKSCMYNTYHPDVVPIMICLVADFLLTSPKILSIILFASLEMSELDSPLFASSLLFFVTGRFILTLEKIYILIPHSSKTAILKYINYRKLLNIHSFLFYF